MIDVDIIIKFPSRSRPDKMLHHLFNISNTIRTGSYMVYLIMDEDDKTITDDVHKKILELSSGFMNIRTSWTRSKSKIDAINRKVPEDISWKYMVVTSDDMEFKMDGWGQIVIDAFKYTGKGCLHFPDGHNNNLITLPVISRMFHDRFGYVYHPSYFSVFADNEMTQVAKITNEYYFVPIGIVEHKHYRWGFGPADAQSKMQDSLEVYNKDSQVFFNRKASNFGL